MPLCAVLFSFVYHKKDGGMLLFGRKLPFSLCEIQIRGTERRAQVRLTCLIFEHFEPWTETQLNLRTT
jgi:hypothetical protein